MLKSSRAAEYSTRHAERFMDARTGMNRSVRGVGLFSADMYEGDVSVERDETSQVTRYCDCEDCEHGRDEEGLDLELESVWVWVWV